MSAHNTTGFMTAITVTGYRGCDRLVKTFYVTSETDFAREVAEWANTHGVTEWSRDNR